MSARLLSRLGVLGLLALLAATPASARRGVKVPVDVGVGPAAYWFFGPVADERWPMPHFGLKLSVAAVLDEGFLRSSAAIPEKYRSMARGLTEVRIPASPFIPDALILSPRLPGRSETSVWGATWRPFGVGFPLLGKKSGRGVQRPGPSLDLDFGLLLTYAYVRSTTVPTTHFVRPGLDGMLELELPFGESFLVSLGWASQLYVPQKLGSFGFGPLRESVFHVGQAFLKLHVRFPYEANL